MTFEINGVNGKYDGYVSDASVRYGRNSVANHQNLIMSTVESGMTGVPPIIDLMPDDKTMDNNIKKFHAFADDNDKYLKSLPPLEYEYRYMPKPVDGVIDKKAALAAAREELGTASMPIREFEHNFLPNHDYTIKPLDLNKNGNIDVQEYAVSMLAADMLSKNNPNITKIDGSINSKGMDAVMEYAKISNAEAAAKLYSQIHATYSFNEIA